MLGKMIDVNFDFRSDTPPGKDPDSHSPTLRMYHKILWSKPLPTNREFTLQGDRRGSYLYHFSEHGEFKLSSDTIINGFANFKGANEVRKHFSRNELDGFERSTYTIGGMMIFPSNQINRIPTINQMRGMHPKIKDRFDLTLECIRLHYLDFENPLSKTLKLHSAFFNLFIDFKRYIQFFHLQDLVTADFNKVNYFTPFDDFKTSPLPQTSRELLLYLQKAKEFIEARNRRIANLRWP